MTPISKGRVFISPYSIMKLYNVKCFKGENINYLVPFKFLPEQKKEINAVKEVVVVLFVLSAIHLHTFKTIVIFIV